MQRYLDYSGVDDDIAHDMYREDAVLEFPQSGERFEGVENFREWRRIYPAEVGFEILRVRGRDDFWTVDVMVSYGGGPWNHGLDILEFRGDKVVHETIYVMEGWEAPQWRAKWRAAPPREADAGPAKRSRGGRRRRLTPAA